jgi:site-specific recombinase XerD
MQRFKRILSWAKEIEWIKAHPCKEYKCSQKKPRRKKLTLQQLISIEQQHFADPVINYVRDLFLHSCYTGFAFAEAMALREEHFEWHPDGSVWCLIYRQKSEELSAVPILKFAARLLNKYRERPDYVKGDPIFPRITNQTVNDKLKIIQAVCGIEFDLTFHIARHTFATTVALKNGIPMEIVQIFLGHTKIETTKIYAEVDEEKITEDTEGWEEKIERKREIALAARQLEATRDSIRHWAN